MTRYPFGIALVTCTFVLCAGAAEAQPEGQPCNSEPTDQLVAYGDQIQPCSIGIVGDSDLFRFQGSLGEVVLIKVVDFSGGAGQPELLTRASTTCRDHRDVRSKQPDLPDSHDT